MTPVMLLTFLACFLRLAKNMYSKNEAIETLTKQTVFCLRRVDPISAGSAQPEVTCG